METQPDFPTPDFTTAEPALTSEPATAPPPAPEPSPAHKFFLGRYGLRAGWGMLLYLIFFIVFSIFISVGMLAATGKLKPLIAERKAAALARKNHTAAPAKPPVPKAPEQAIMKPKSTAINEAASFAAIALAAIVLSLIERRRVYVYGIGETRLLDFLPGAFWGLASLSLLVFALHSFHVLYFDSRLLTGSAITLYGLKWALCFVLVGLSEEYLLRGYLQYTLTRGLIGLAENISPENARFVAFWIAAAIMSLLFGALHLGNSGENAFGISQVVLVGIVFSYALWRTGSLWWAIGFHFAWDWAQSFLYGVADSGNISVGRLFQTHIAGKPLLSGGIDGPEGSILCVPTMLLVLLIIRFTTTPGLQPLIEQAPIPTAPPQETHPVIA